MGEEFLSECLVTEIKDHSELGYQEFYTTFLESNQPCIIRNYLEHVSWNASKDWVKDEEPCLDFFLEHLSPEHQVPVYSCDERYFNSQVCLTETIGEYRKYWRSPRHQTKYLKDWHFLKESKEYLDLKNYSSYSTPIYFSSDWLNEWLEFRDLRNEDDLENSTDYKFVYIGPQGSWTPFHTDVFGSFSWSANIVGIKRWIFLAPGEEQKVETRPGTYVYDILSNESLSLQEKNGKVVSCEVVQNPGDVIFVPSGWFHQVYNEKDALSINHNWLNAANINYILTILNQQLARVESEISDCRDDNEWTSLCQNLLRQHHGMNHLDFLEMIKCIMKRRMSMEESVETEADLPAGKSVLKELIAIFTNIGLESEIAESSSLLHQINSYLETRKI